MRRRLRQLVGTAITLVYLLNQIGLVDRTIGRRTIVEGTTGTRHIHLAGHDILPDARQVLHQLLLARLGIDIGHTGIEVVGANGVTHRIVLLAEGDAVLVVIRTILDHAADVDQVLREFEVARVARSTIHLHHTHVVRGADGIAGQLSRSRLVEMAEEVGRLNGGIEQGAFARSTIVRDTGHHQVAEVIGLEVQAIGEGTLLIGTTHLRADGLLGCMAMGVDTLVALVDNHRRMDVAIFTLCLHDTRDERIHDFIQLGIFRDGVDGGYTLHPFVHIAIVERRSIVMSFALAGCNLKVAEAMREVCIAPDIPHVLHRGAAIHGKAFAPETAGPANSSQRHIGHFRKAALTHIGQAGRSGILCLHSRNGQDGHRGHSNRKKSF